MLCSIRFGLPLCILLCFILGLVCLLLLLCVILSLLLRLLLCLCFGFSLLLLLFPPCRVSVIRFLHFINSPNTLCGIYAVQMFWSHSYIVLKLIIHGKKYILLTAPLTQNKNSSLLLFICYFCSA